MTLTKKYRLIWTEQKQIISDPEQDRSGTTTYVGAGRHGFESNSQTDIQQKIQELGLKPYGVNKL